MNCLICKIGTYAPGKVTVKIERGTSIVLIKEVPADVCDTCSNYLVDQSTTREILDIANKAFDNGAELEIRTLNAAA
jgi:YgiT-type zinc finger domain-containing protein